MASEANQATPSTTPELLAPRSVQLFRAAVLFVAGIVIAFTAPLHTDVGFDIWLIAATLTLIAVATFLEYYAMRGTLESWWIAARSIIALGAAGALIVIADSLTMALVVAIWAGLTAVITVMRLARGAQPRRIALPSLLLSLALAIAVLIFRNDPVAVIGFFGAYAVIRGVFLAIAAFDSSVKSAGRSLETERETLRTSESEHD